MSDLDQVRALALAEARRSPTSPWSHDVVRLAFVYLGVLGGSLAVGHWVFGAALRPVASSLVPLGVALVVGVVAAITPRHLGRWTWGAWAVIAVGTCAHFMTLRAGSGRSFFADADCALAEMAVAALPAIATVALLRGFAYRIERALTGGAAAALVGLATLDLTCPAGGLAHVFAFHLAPAVLVVALAALWRRRARTRSFVP